MQRYWWPGYEMQLLGELQRQQNSAQFCDTLLQTEGISVPTHSCILAALSPYLSQRLSASPSPPSGQKRQLQLQAVKAQTLLKVVGLLYSGELEVKGSVEQNDVLAVAHLFGIRDLVQRQNGRGMTEGEIQEKMQSLGSCRGNSIHAECSEREERKKMHDAQVQAEMAGRRDKDSLVKSRSCVSTATQTVKAGKKSVGSCTCSSQAPTPACTPSVVQNVDFSVMSQLQNITLDKLVCSTSSPVIPNMSSGAQNDGQPTLDQSSCSVINSKPTSALSNNMMTTPSSLNDDSNSPTPQENTYQQFSACGNSIQALAKKRTGLEDRYKADNRKNTEQLRQASRDEILGEERGKSTEKRNTNANAGMKNLAKMKQMQQMLETAQISIKVKLRRRTQGEVWEVVSTQDTNETSSVLTSQKQDGSNHKGPQTDLTNIQPPPSTVELCAVHKPETVILQPATTSSPKPPPHPNTSCVCQPPSSDCFTLNQRDGCEAAPLPQAQGAVEESDEQIEKLLEDIMMGLNILPNLERDSKKSHHLQPSHNGAPTIFQVPVTQNDTGHSQMHTAVSAAGCVFYQDLGTQSGHSSTDTGIHCSLTAQNQPDTSLSSVQPDTALIQQQQLHDHQYPSSVRSMGGDGLNCQNMLLSKSQECLHPEAPTTRFGIPSVFFSGGQKQHYPAFQEMSSQNNQNVLGFLPMVTGNETQPLHTVSLPSMDDLRLPQCLSPLGSCTTATKHQAILNPVNLGDKIQQQPSLHGRPWLAENPGSLQFPLSAITHRRNESASLPQDMNCSCWPKQQQELNPQNGGAWAESCTVKEVEERETVSAAQQNVVELKSDPRKIKGSLKCCHSDITGDAVAPKKRKRKLTSHPQDAGSLSAYKDVKVSDGTKGQINLSGCSVSLSSNNVLAKEREMATSSASIQYKIVGKPNHRSSITESLRENTKEFGVNPDQNRIRTRGFMKKTQESPTNTSPQNSSVPKPVSCTANIVNNRDTLYKRKRGRPPKAKAEELTSSDNSSAVVEEKSYNGGSVQQIDRGLSSEDLEKRDKTKREYKKRRTRSTEVEVKSISTESTGKLDANNNDIIPIVRKLGTLKRPRMVTLKEFKRLIKRQHSKTRKSKEGQEINETVRDAESEEIISRDSTCNESREKKETKMDIDITQPQQGGKNEESPIMVSALVGENQTFNKSTAEKEKSQRDDIDSSTSKSVSLVGDDVVFSSDVLHEEVPKLADEKEPPQKNPDEGKSCDTGYSNTTQEAAIDSEESSQGDTHLLQENKLHPQTSERTGPHLSDPDGISRISGCDPEEEEDVDVLVYSPDRVRHTKECENGLNHMEITPDEEEEEDVNEIDVTGDEAE